MDSDQVTDAFIRRHGDAIGECGPVMRRVHEAYWEYGSDGIPTPKKKATVDAGTAAFIDAVAEKYGRPRHPPGTSRPKEDGTRA